MTREISDPRVGFATITQVETTRDLRHAKVWVSVIGQPAERDATMAALRHAVPFIRHELGRTLRIKRIPDLHLQLDDTAERDTPPAPAERDRSRVMPDADVPVAESLPTPIGRVPQLDDLAEEPPSAVHKPDPNAKRRYRAGGRSGGGRPTRHGSSR